MLFFPQLASGTLVQYPLTKRRTFRTIVNELAGGGSLKLMDPNAAKVVWELRFEALRDAERQALETFFESVEGRLGEFVWLDPTGNLLRYSDALSETVWTRGPLLEATAGIGDPEGGTRATRLHNAGAAAQALQQTVAAPGWFHYCFSMYLRSEAGAEVNVYRTSGSAAQQETHRAGREWRRVALGGTSGSAAESVTFGLSVAPGGTVEVYGLQAEAQPAASAYRRTASAGAVYSGARFDQDTLAFTTNGPEEHGCAMRIVARAGI